MTKIYKAILPCAGIGSRMAPITKIFPKEMLPLNCKPAIYFVIKECIDAGINDFLVIISLRKKILVDYLIDEFGDKVKLTFINQQIANGLAKAVELGKEWSNNQPVYFVNPDNLFSDSNVAKDIISAYNGKTLLSSFEGGDDDMKKFAVMEMESDGISINKILEKPEPKDTKSRTMGYWRAVLNPEVFDTISLISPGKNNEYQLTDALQLLVADNKLQSYRVSNDIEHFDLGNKSGYANANVYFTKKDL